jgi:hypothetical protein
MCYWISQCGGKASTRAIELHDVSGVPALTGVTITHTTSRQVLLKQNEATVANDKVLELTLKVEEVKKEQARAVNGVLETIVTWECNVEGSWKQYEDGINADLEKAYKQGAAELRFETSHDSLQGGFNHRLSYTHSARFMVATCARKDVLLSLLCWA